MRKSWFPTGLGPMMVPLALVAGGLTTSGSCGEAQARLRGPSHPTPSYATEGTEEKSTLPPGAAPASAPTSFPSFAQTPPTPADPDALPSIEDPTGKALLSFFEGLRRAEAKSPDGRVAIIQFGDSHTAADLGTSQLRHLLQKRFGDAGRGFMLPGRPFRAYYQRDASFGSEGDWQIQNGLKQSAQEPFGLAGIRTSSDSVKARAWVGTCDDCEAGSKVSRFEIFYRKAPQGGALKILVDDQPTQEISTRPNPHEDELLGGYWEINVPDGAHQLTLQPSGTGTVDLFGVVMERDTPGVVLDAIGINGAQAMHLLRWDWSLISEHLARRDPKLVILAYGTNESANTNFSAEQHQKDVETLIANVKSAVPNASILVVGPPDRGVRERNDCERTIYKGKGKNRKKITTPRLTPDGKIPQGCEWKTPPVIPEIVMAQRRAAQNQGVAFFDTYRAMGGSGSIDLWATLNPPLAQRDRTHLSREGYKKNADILFDALMRAYESYLAVAPKLPTFEEMKEEAGRAPRSQDQDTP